MKRLTLLLFCLACFLLTGCGVITTKEEQGKPLYSVVDAFGNRVNFTAKPQRIVSLNTSIDEILLDLVPAERIQGLTYLVDDPSISCAAAKAGQVKGRVYGGNFEAIVAMNPDLVLTASFMGPGYCDALKAAGLKVVTCTSANTVQEIMTFINQVAEAVGEKERGREMTAKLQRDLLVVRKKALAGQQGKMLRVLALSTMGIMGPEGPFNDLCYYAGIKNALAEKNVPAQAVLSEELLLELNPDVLFMPSWDYTKKKDVEGFAKKILENPLYKDVGAVKHKRFYKLHDQYLYSTSQYTLKAVEEMAKLCYNIE